MTLAEKLVCALCLATIVLCVATINIAVGQRNLARHKTAACYGPYQMPVPRVVVEDMGADK